MFRTVEAHQNRVYALSFVVGDLIRFCNSWKMKQTHNFKNKQTEQQQEKMCREYRNRNTIGNRFNQSVIGDISHILLCL